MLKKINFYIATFIPQKIYWYMAGLFHPWEAVLEYTNDPKVVYQKSSEVVSTLEKMKLINKNSIVLDIGCGVGRAEYGLAGKVKKSIGVDISLSMINLARKNIKGKNVEFFTNNGLDLKQFPDGEFDLVLSFLVFQHLPREKFVNYLKESKRVLNGNGKLLFQIPLKDFFFKEPPKNHPWALRHYSLEEIKSILRNAGFKGVNFFNIDGGVLGKKDSQALCLVVK